MAGIQDNHEDILDPRRKGSDIRFALQTLRGVPEYKYINQQTPKEVKEQVLKSQRLRHVIEQLSSEKGLEEDVIYKEADAILEEMGHNLNMTTLRSLATIFANIFRQLFRHIYVNQSGIQKMRALMKESPVVLLPTHRSYLDFLLMSYILFHYHLPLPFIAAGADFMQMKFVGEILRRCGGFFIRRSFGSDRLYWAVFTEYVQINLTNSEGPLEFFVEGTRSRTGKFLSPKLGLLSVVAEPFLKGAVPDVTLVPISISYERIVEEKLHAQEMLGIPKPKESTSGLLKARSIFQEDFGSIVVHFCDPISLRDQMKSIDRSRHNLIPRFIFSATPEEQRLIGSVAQDVQQVQRDHMIMSPWVLCAACLLQRPDSYTLRELTSQVAWLKDMIRQYGIQVDWPVGTGAQDIIHSAFKIHHSLVKQHKDGEITFSRSLHSPNASVDTSTREGVLTHAAVHMDIAMYRNYLAASLAVQGLVSLSFCGLDKCSQDELYEQYQFLVKLFTEEFTSNPSHSKQKFDRTVSLLVACGALDHDREEVRVTAKGEREIAFFTDMMSPFLLGYWLVCQYLMAHPSSPQGVPIKQTAKDIQMRIATIISQGKLHHYEILSLNLLTNALTALTHMGILVREKSDNGPLISWSAESVSRVADKISEFIQVPTDMTSFSQPGEVALTAKL
ncbi:dihydroxyacetone phosphate acyltransferase [Strongylocentrotus purpuratus]|uniref:Phospholipid/glycerol acyltransferase domain-containing protein n=1 Tax=Strongylocentrotus purpuratus TaxID=7668 RepID=A0A7M7PT84_STRPU|nr:dihydroxyacetone phosphate acyltransferase [Strongylocentrotus purpuratus]XP_030855185.1 dihydroxyacetone phosphate acyltransferase [Strongylocentrotus purpuratus]